MIGSCREAYGGFSLDVTLSIALIDLSLEISISKDLNASIKFFAGSTPANCPACFVPAYLTENPTLRISRPLMYTSTSDLVSICPVVPPHTTATSSSFPLVITSVAIVVKDRFLLTALIASDTICFTTEPLRSFLSRIADMTSAGRPEPSNSTISGTPSPLSTVHTARERKKFDITASTDSGVTGIAVPSSYRSVNRDIIAAARTNSYA